MPIVDFIDDQHESYMRQEQQPERLDKVDMRVHACLYFIRPTGHTCVSRSANRVQRSLTERIDLSPSTSKS